MWEYRVIEERRRYNQNLASIIGKMGGMIDLVKMTALHRRQLQWIVQNSWDQSRDS